MCGIYGFIADLYKPLFVLERMGAALLHRGPDDQGRFLKGRVGMGHNRLSVIDRSVAGHQPMTLKDSELTIVFNGEIFNYIELRDVLGVQTYHSQTDTEVLLRAYEKWGEGCLDHLIGMFAFAIWDEHAHKLFLARDRFGVKPLYYSITPDGFFFASEPKGLFAAGIHKRPDLPIWSRYLTSGTYDHSASTFFEGVWQLEPGHCMSVSLSGDFQDKCYYDLSNACDQTTAGKITNAKRAQAEYFELLENAVTLSVRSDVSVGIAVSGGLDSGTLVAMLRRILVSPEDIKAFTYTCGHPDYDETPWVRMLLSQERHPWFVAQLGPKDIENGIAAVAKNQEEPFGGFNTICLADLCQLAKSEDVTVLLDGNGLDEQWAGYEYYAKHEWTPAQFFAGPVQGSKSATCRPECLMHDFREIAAPVAFPAPFDNLLDNLRFRDLRYTKIPRALRFSDRASMMQSRELRVPFLDHRLVEYSFKLDPSLLIRDQQHKYLLRKMVSDLLPQGLLQAPKRIMHTPQREWLAHELLGFVTDILHSKSFRELGWFDPVMVEKEWSGYKNAPPDNSFFVWQWISAALLAE